MRKNTFMIATTLLLILFMIPIEQSPVEAQRPRSRTRVEPTATPVGFMPTPSPTPGIRAGGGGGCTITTLDVELGLDDHNIVGNTTGQLVVFSSYDDPPQFEILPRHVANILEEKWSYSDEWLVTTDNDYDGVCTTRPNPLFGQTHLWKRTDLSHPVTTFDVNLLDFDWSYDNQYVMGFLTIDPSDVLTIPDRSRVRLVNVSDPNVLYTLEADPLVKDAIWAIDGTAIAALVDNGDGQPVLAFYDPKTGHKIMQIATQGDPIKLLTSLSMGFTVAVSDSDVTVTLYDATQNISTPLHATTLDSVYTTIRSTVQASDQRQLWNSDYTRFVSIMSLPNSVVNIYDINDMDNPIILDMSEVYPAGIAINTVAWSSNDEELLISVISNGSGSLAWWSLADTEPVLIDILTMRVPNEPSDDFFTDWQIAQHVEWLYDDTMIVAATNLRATSALFTWDLTLSREPRFIAIPWNDINIVPEMETVVILQNNEWFGYIIEEELEGVMGVNLFTLDTFPIVEFSNLRSIYPPLPIPRLAPQFVCDGTLEPRLSLYTQGRVASGLANNVRSAPGIGAEVVAKLPSGSQFDVKSDPVCSDGYVWYKIRFGEFSENVGWTVESGDGVYWLEPDTPRG